MGIAFASLLSHASQRAKEHAAFILTELRLWIQHVRPYCAAAMQTKGGNFFSLYAIKTSFLESQISLLFCSSLPVSLSCLHPVWNTYISACLLCIIGYLGKKQVSLLQIILDRWYKEGNGLICVLELLTQSPNTSDCQVRKVFAMKTFSMKAILEKVNSFK